MAKNPARNPKVTRRTKSTSAGPKGSLRKATPAKRSSSRRKT